MFGLEPEVKDTKDHNSFLIRIITHVLLETNKIELIIHTIRSNKLGETPVQPQVLNQPY